MVTKDSEEPHFQWKDILKYLYLHIWQLLISVTVSMKVLLKSVGIRISTQIIDCVISVVMLLLQLTATMLSCMPTIIFIDTLLGKSLGKLCTEAHN